MSEPTIQQVRAAVSALPHHYIVELAKGPLTTDDPDDCRICELFDDWVYAPPEVSETDAILTLIDWHRFYGSPSHDGRGQEAARRCQVIYNLARAVVA